MQQPLTAPPDPALPGDPAGPARARRLLWWTCGLFILTIGIGRAWDAYWHVTRAFDTFFSPPHLFVYAMTVFLALLVTFMIFSRAFRLWFGAGFRVAPLPFAVPGALIILAGGFAILALAGLLDSIWHTRFGLDETAWSTPHAMIGWALLVAALGFVACRLALRPYRPLSWRTAVLLGYLILGFSAAPFLGPFYGNTTPGRVRAVAAIPVLAAQPEAQHTFRIYLDWGLTRANPVLIPLGALWAGAALALVRGLDRRPWVVLTTTGLWSLLALLGERRSARRLDQLLPVSDDPASWLPLPLFLAALALVMALEIDLSERWAWAAAGVIFGLAVFLAWGAHPLAALLVIVAAPAMVCGARLGQWSYRALERPLASHVRRLLLAGVGVPLVVGIIDLALRAATPWP